jgi:hypothetical protein
MTRRAFLLMRVAAVLAVVAGVNYALASWAAGGNAAAGTPLFGFAASRGVLAFANDATGGLKANLTLPWLLLTEPFIWLGLGLVLTPSVYQRLKRRAAADDPSYAGYAFVECPECRHVVPMSAKRCPLCGAELFAPWANASRYA